MKRHLSLAAATIAAFLLMSAMAVPAAVGGPSFPAPGDRAASSGPGPSSGPTSGGNPVGSTARYVPGQILVKFREVTGASGAAALLSRAGATAVRRITASGLQQVDVKEEDVRGALDILRSSPSVEYAEPNYIRSASVTNPNDPWYAGTPPAPAALQWNMENAPGSGGIDMPHAWDITRGATSVVVAILDTGVAYRNGGGYTKAPDLTNNFKQGYDFINNDPYADDDHGHGTHVCGTVAQATDNGLDCAGVADGTTVMPVKVLDRTGYGDDAQIIQGIEWATDHGADVINMSLGGPDPSMAIEEAVDYAFGKDVVVCAAAGNADLGAVEYPAAYSACVAVGATSKTKTRAGYSNYGSTLDVAAPGGDASGAIYQVTFRVTSQPSSGFGVRGFEGTSMATPHVSAVAALLKAVHPTWSAADIRGTISSSCHDLGSAGWDRYFGWGLVDAYAALQAARPSSQAPDPQTVLPPYGSAGATAQLAIGGTGFSSRVKVLLERIYETPLAATGVAVTGSTKVSCAMPLAGAEPGLWDVVVENAAMKEGRLDGGFNVDNADNRVWYLAEGSTAHGFEEYILIQNPNSTAASVTLDLMATGGSVPGTGAIVPANSRLTIRVNDVAPEQDLSAKVTADQNIICERSMYWAGRIEGTDSIGVQSPSYSWFLAEGTTAYGFETFVLIQNPSNRPATVQVIYMTPTGPVARDAFSIAQASRYTINVADDLPSSDASVMVLADRRVICERSMYWDARRGGHVSTGTVMPSTRWYLAEGSTDWGYQEYVLIENPADVDANVVLTYMTPSGAVPQPAMKIAANTRATVNVNAALPGKDVSVQVTSDVGVVAERSMYWDYGTGKAGHNQIGVPQPRQQCYLAEGSTDWGFDEWVLIQNPNPAPANVGINYMTSSGLRPMNAFVLAANSRVSVHVNADVPGVDTSTHVFSNLPIIAERSMYWNNKNAGHCSNGLMK